jgi:MFS family permease
MFGCALAGFSSLYCTQALGSEMEQLFGLSLRRSAALLTATTCALAVASPLAGRIVERLGARMALMLGLTLLGLLATGLAGASSWGSLLTLRIAQGVAMPLVLSALLSSIEGQISETATLGMAATYVSGTLCGGVLGRLLPALLIPSSGWSGAFLGLAVLHLAALALAATRFRGLPATRPSSDARVRTGSLGSAHHAATFTAGSLRFVVVLAGGFALLFSQVAVFTFIPFRLTQAPFGWSTAALGQIYLVFLPALAFVRLSRQAVSRFGHGRSLGLAIAWSWAGLLTTLIDRPVCVVAGLMVFGIAVFFAQAVLAHAVSVVPARSRAVVSGLYLFSYYAGGSLGAIAPVLVWSHQGWVGCLALIAGVQFALPVLALGLTRSGRLMFRILGSINDVEKSK